MLVVLEVAFDVAFNLQPGFSCDFALDAVSGGRCSGNWSAQHVGSRRRRRGGSLRVDNRHVVREHLEGVAQVAIDAVQEVGPVVKKSLQMML